MRLIKRKIRLDRLNRNAFIYIGIPDNYHFSEKRYPVLYMHDGNNVFLNECSFSGISWGILDAYSSKSDLPEIIVIAIECASGQERFNEYSGFPFEFSGFDAAGFKPVGKKGDLYLTTLIYDIKPKIDAEFRTIPEKEFTGMLGSSMGGVITHYAALKYSDFFTRFGSLSSAFFVSEKFILKAVEAADLSNVIKYYMSVGTSETAGGLPEDYLSSNIAVYESMSKKIAAEKILFDIIQNGIHSESAWAKQLPAVIRYLFC